MMGVAVIIQQSFSQLLETLIWLGPGLVLFMLSYVTFMVFIVYYCVMADPSTSSMAQLLTESLPNFVSSQLSKCLSPKAMKMLSFIGDRVLAIVYLIIVLGVWSVVFWFIYPWITESKHVSNVHKVIGYLVFGLCIFSWRRASTTSPGIITHETVTKFDNYPYDNLLFLSDRICPTTRVIRLPRSKFDRSRYHQNVARFDHFCGWVNNTIGEENYRDFLFFLLVHAAMCLYGTVVLGLLFRGEIIDKKLFQVTFFNVRTKEEFKANWHVVGQYLFVHKTSEAGAFVVMLVMAIVIGIFLGYHVYLVSLGMTTNENDKWNQVRSWHKKQLQKYRDAVKKGLVNDHDAAKQAAAMLLSSSSSSSTPSANQVELIDGDVTCTTGMGATSQTSANKEQQQRQQEQHKHQSASTSLDELYYDPGPMPKNIYNQGFVENWKEVLFPRSLRKDALQRYQQSRLQSQKQNNESPDDNSGKLKRS